MLRAVNRLHKHITKASLAGLPLLKASSSRQVTFGPSGTWTRGIMSSIDCSPIVFVSVKDGGSPIVASCSTHRGNVIDASSAMVRRIIYTSNTHCTILGRHARALTSRGDVQGHSQDDCDSVISLGIEVVSWLSDRLIPQAYGHHEQTTCNLPSSSQPQAPLEADLSYQLNGINHKWHWLKGTTALEALIYC